MTVRAGDLNSAKSASGYSLAVLADYFVPPYFPLYPYYNLTRAFWPDFRKKFCLGGSFLTFQNVPFRKKMQAIYISSVDF